MTGRGYDDEGRIAAVEALMAIEPGLSRRAAILRVAGEGSLRRIELKMQRRSEASEGVLAWPSAGLEGDADAYRLAQREAALPLAAGERKIWSGQNSRSACAAAVLAYRHPRFALAERVRLWCGTVGFMGLVLMVALMVGATAAFALLPWTRPMNGVAGWVLLGTFGVAVAGLGVHIPLELWAMKAQFSAMDGARERLRRFVVTDRSVYTLSARDGGVAWRRQTYGSFTAAETGLDGSVRVMGSAGEVCLSMLADAAGLVEALGGRRDTPAPSC